MGQGFESLRAYHFQANIKGFKPGLDQGQSINRVGLFCFIVLVLKTLLAVSNSQKRIDLAQFPVPSMKSGGGFVYCPIGSLSYFHGPIGKYDGAGFKSFPLMTCGMLGVRKSPFLELTSLCQSKPGHPFLVSPVEKQAKVGITLSIFYKRSVEISFFRTSILQQQAMIFPAKDPAFPGIFLNLVIVRAAFAATFFGHRGNTMIRKNPDAMSQEEILTDVARILFGGYQKLIKRQNSRNGNLTKFEGKTAVSSSDTNLLANGHKTTNGS